MFVLLVLVCMTIHWERPNSIKFYICIFTQGSNIDCVVTKEHESKLEELIELFLAIHTFARKQAKPDFPSILCDGNFSWPHPLPQFL